MSQVCRDGHIYEEPDKCPVCRRASNHRRYLRHRDAYLARAKRWREENPERSREAVADWRKRNPDYNRHYYEDKVNSHARRTPRHGESDHPLYKRLMSSARKASKRGAQVSNVLPSQAEQLFEAQGRRCFRCQIPMSEPTRLIHKVATYRGGAHTLDNLAWTCGCNRSRMTPMGRPQVSATIETEVEAIKVAHRPIVEAPVAITSSLSPRLVPLAKKIARHEPVSAVEGDDELQRDPDFAAMIARLEIDAAARRTSKTGR